MKYLESFNEKVKVNLSCADCGGKTEAYFIKDDIWNNNVPKSKQKKSMCLSCLEKRVGRKLKKSDFKLFKSSEIYNHQYWWNNMDESVRDLMKPKSEEEIQIAVKNTIDTFLDKAYRTGYSRTKIEFIGTEYKKYIEKYIIGDGLFDIDEYYLLYKDKVFKMSSIPGGDYYTKLDVIPETIDELKIKLKEMLKKLEE